MSKLSPDEPSIAPDGAVSAGRHATVGASMNETGAEPAVAAHPPPLLPSHVALRDFRFAPLDVVQLQNSKTGVVANADRVGNQKMAAKQTPEQRYTEMLDAQEFHQIKKFVAACRRQWPGAMIVLRPDSAPTGANAPPNLNLAPGEKSNARI
jgi:hypothetical protein